MFRKNVKQKKLILKSDFSRALSVNNSPLAFVTALNFFFEHLVHITE